MITVEADKAIAAILDPAVIAGCDDERAGRPAIDDAEFAVWTSDKAVRPSEANGWRSAEGLYRVAISVPCGGVVSVRNMPKAPVRSDADTRLTVALQVDVDCGGENWIGARLVHHELELFAGGLGKRPACGIDGFNNLVRGFHEPAFCAAIRPRGKFPRPIK